MCVRASADSENQDATKITSALADARICPFTEMMTLYMYILVITIFLNVLHSFFPSFVTMSTSRPADVCVTNNSYQGPILEDHDRPTSEDCCYKEEEQCDSELESEDDGWLGTENHWCPLLHFDISLLHWSITPRIHGTR